MFFFILDIISIFLTFIIKIIYHTLILLYKILRFILYKSFLRTPFLLIIFGWLFKISYIYISTIYFLYLMNRLALKLNIYTIAKQNIRIFYTKLLYEIKINKSLKDINPEFILLKNLLIEENNNNYNVNHLLITKGGVFNIKMIENQKAFTIDNPPIEYISYNSTLRDILPLEIPLLNILLLPESKEEISYYYNSSPPMIPLNYLNDFVSKKFRKRICYEPEEIRDIILESSLLNIDKYLFNIHNFLLKNKKIILFLSITALMYYFYINFLVILINYFRK